jgi:mono/diheme cytochrome c family protein
MQRNRILKAALISTALSIAAAGANAQGKVDLGKREYDANCATCHGVKGTGNGPSAGILSKSVPDLTTLAKRNGGVFPINRVFDTIEGEGIASHGSRDMPIWGMDYKIKAAEYYMDVPYNAEAYVRTRLLSLVDYLYRLQLK